VEHRQQRYLNTRAEHAHQPTRQREGRDETQPARQRDLGKSCERRFNDVTDPICAGQHQPLRGWLLCLYVRKLNLSNQPMAKELDRYPSAVQQLTWQ
jgi:hypothetical protein